MRRNTPEAERIRLAEADIELDLGDGVTVNGRIDLVRTVQAADAIRADDLRRLDDSDSCGDCPVCRLCGRR